MKKGIKKYLIGIIIGIIISSTGIVVAYNLKSNDISFNPKNSDFEANNVEDALNILYEKSGSEITEFGKVFTNYSFSDVIENATLSLNLEAGNYICEANTSIAYHGSNSNDNQVSSWDIINIEGATNYKKLNYNFYKNSSTNVYPGNVDDNAKHIYTYNGTELFTCSSSSAFSITQSTSLGWTNDSCPMIMNIKCVMYKSE